MNCYNHPTTPAVGICKNCNKGICKDCTTDLGDGIACTSTCVEQVQMINTLIERNHKTQNTTIGSRNSAAILYLSLGVLVGFTSLVWLKRFDPFLIGMGVIFVGYGVYTLIITGKLKDRDDNF